MNIKALFERDNRKRLGDVCLNIGATALFNMVLQFALYPYFLRCLGEETYGVALSLLSLVAIIAAPFGYAANYSRLVNVKALRPANGDYLLPLFLSGILSAFIGIFYLWYLELLTPVTIGLYAALMFFTVFRCYSDVEFKLNVNFLRYFFFYLAISVGYLAGLLVYRWTGQWLTAILTGEILGILYSAFASKIYRRPLRPSQNFGLVCKSIGLLFLSNLLENLTLNADRLLLLAMEGGTAVTIYYTASLFGKVVALLTVPVNSLVISYLIRYDKGLSKKLWTIFVACGIGGGLVCTGGCILFSHIFIPFLYEELYETVKPFLVPAILSQIFYFVSGILLVVLLRFRGEKKQFFLNLIYAVSFFALVIAGTYFYGLKGFVWFSLIANAFRFIIVVIWGFFSSRDKKSDSPSMQSAEENITVG